MSRIHGLGGGDPRIAVAVLDGPVDVGHPCFNGAQLEFPRGQPDFDPQDAAARHGTHVASIIFGQPGSAVEGIAPRCRGLVIPVFAGGAADGFRCSQLDLARAILAALENGVHIINISGGEVSSEDGADGFLADALAKCEAAGVLVVAAAGNDGTDCVHMPAAVRTVLAVGAADREGAPLPFSNWGAAYAANGILAPGEGIEGALPGGGTARRTGTSFATPIVTGIAARMLADQLSRGGRPDPLQVRRALIGTAISCDPRNSEQCLAGRLNPGGAILELNGGRRAMSSLEITHEQDQPTAGAVRASAAEEWGADLAPTDIVGGAALRQQGAGEGMTPSDCGCGCGGEKKKDCGCGCGGAKAVAQAQAVQKVFALGQLGYDFGTEARRDSILQFLQGKPKPEQEFVDFLLEKLAPDTNGDGVPDIQPEAERVIWTLNLDQTPIYAIRPAGAFAFNGYAQILNAFKAQRRPKPAAGDRQQKKGRQAEPEVLPEPVTLFSVAGVVAGSVRLMSGETVPVIVPSPRGLIHWDLGPAHKAFVEKLAGEPAGSPGRQLLDRQRAEFDRRFMRSLGDFKDLMTRKHRNLGIMGRERALNFAASSAFRAFEVLRELIQLDLIIDDVAVLKSPACRPGSECYDVQIKAFRESDVTAALRVFQFTLDVSDTIPVSIGEIAIWSERARS